MLNTDLLIKDSNVIFKNVPIQKLNNKNILITGGSGLIGTHLLYGLYICKSMGINVNVTYITNNNPPEYLQKLPFRYFALDLTNLSWINRISVTPDIIIHCATYGQPYKFLKDKIKTIKLNTTITSLLMEYFKPEKFLFISTSELYTGLESDYYTEEQIGTSNTTHPRACYIESKKCGEVICNIFRENGIDAKSIRLCLAYGPGTKINDARVLNSFIEKALVNKKIELLDKGEALRTYGYISDCIYMIWKILLEGTQSIYNVGGQSTLKIIELATMIGEMLNVPVIINDKSSGLEGTPKHTQLSLERFFKEFGPMKFVEMNEGLQKTIEWQKGLYL